MNSRHAQVCMAAPQLLSKMCSTRRTPASLYVPKAQCTLTKGTHALPCTRSGYIYKAQCASHSTKSPEMGYTGAQPGSVQARPQHTIGTFRTSGSAHCPADTSPAMTVCTPTCPCSQSPLTMLHQAHCATPPLPLSPLLVLPPPLLSSRPCDAMLPWLLRSEQALLLVKLTKVISCFSQPVDVLWHLPRSPA